MKLNKSFCEGSRGAVFSKRAPLAAGGKILVLFFLFWFGILILCGTLFSGYHFMDDHGILRESKEVINSNILKEAKIFKKNLLTPRMRFRPFYWAHRRLMLAAMGTNFTAMSVYVGFLAVFTSFFLFLFMKKTGFSSLESIIFVCLTLLGEQAAIWWRLGNNETLGMLMLSIALLFMALSASTLKRRKKILYEFLFGLFVILASWSKESFILIIPALVFWKIWLTFQKKQEHGPQASGNIKQTTNITVMKAVKENLILGMLLFLVCLLELAHVIRNVGTTKIVYAGYEGFQLKNFIKTGIQGFTAIHGWVILVLLVILCLRRPGALFIKTAPGPRKNFLLIHNQIFWAFILAGLLVVPQIVLYMKSGMMERYLLPGIMGYTFIMVVILRYTRENSSKKVLPVIMLLVLAALSLQQLRITRYTAISFAFEGKQVNAWLRSIEQNTHEQDLILVITHMHRYNEASFSLKAYLDMKSNRKKILFYPTHLKEKSVKARFWKVLNRHFFSQFNKFTLENSGHRNRLQAILVFPGLEEKFLKASAHWFNPELFERYTNAGGYMSFYRKKILNSNI